VYRDQSKRDFFGLRDFYHLIKYLHRELQQVITHELLTLAVLRNFGGRPAEMSLILREFFLRVGINYRTEEAIKLIEKKLVTSPSSSSLVGSSAKPIPVIELIRCNIADRNARHLMVLTHNDAALQILLDDTYKVMEQEGVQKPLVIFGSDFPDDRSDLHIFLNIQRIKSCMADGRPVILIHSDNLYESLYDLLNQHYTSYNGQRFVRLALGTHSRLCPVHYQFRVVVVVGILFIRLLIIYFFDLPHIFAMHTKTYLLLYSIALKSKY
jgi:E3 ubiquitin-protein ligase RNF213